MFLTIVLSIFFGICFYIATAVYLQKFFRNVLKMDSESSGLGAVFWPLTVTILLFVAIPHGIEKFIRWLPTLKQSGTAKIGEIIPGVTKPTDILAGIIATRVIQQFKNLKKAYDYLEWQDDKGVIKIRASRNYSSEPFIYTVWVDNVKVNFNSMVVISKAMDRASELKAEADQQALLFQQENVALSAIETLTFKEKSSG